MNRIFSVVVSCALVGCGRSDAPERAEAHADRSRDEADRSREHADRARGEANYAEDQASSAKTAADRAERAAAKTPQPAEPRPPAAAGRDGSEALGERGQKQSAVVDFQGDFYSANLRSRPSQNGGRLIAVPKGSTVVLTGRVERDEEGALAKPWYEVEYKGITGWLNANSLSIGE